MIRSVSSQMICSTFCEFLFRTVFIFSSIFFVLLSRFIQLLQSSINSCDYNYILYIDAVLRRLPTLTTSSGLSLFSVSSALRFLLSVPKESEILNDRWLEWEISELQVF